MYLYITKRCMKLAYNAIFHVHLKINNKRLHEMQTERKTRTCNVCNKTVAEIRQLYNTTQCCCSCKPEKYDYVEDVVCMETDIRENEMKLLPLGQNGGKILLIKQKGQIHAIGTKCTHYGALLHTGALGDGRIRCPWHGACFNIKTGDIEDYPGLDSLPCFQVNIDTSGFVHVKANRKDLEFSRRIKDMCERDPNNTNTVIIVGGGPAAATCAESLRQENFTGNITMICKENVLPYDRVKVSKAFDLDIEKIILRPNSFYKDHKIETKLDIEAIGLDTNNNILHLNNNEKLIYNYLFICTGSMARMPEIPGVNLSNIHVLRNYTDAQTINSKLSIEKHVIILGLGFIAMEAAAFCAKKCASITIIGRGKTPLQPVFGTDIGNRIKQQFENEGIKFIFEHDITQFVAKKDDSTAVGTVVLNDDQILPADIVIIGIGAEVYTEWIKQSPIEMLPDGTIKVDKYLKTNVENIYAGGDVAYAPLFGSDEISAAIGHYPLAHYHGKIAALNISGKTTALNAVPFFWTTLFGKSYRYVGYGKPEKIRIYGSLEKLEFFAYYIKNNKVIAMSSVAADPIVSDFANFLYEGKTLTETEINRDPFNWIRNKPKDLHTRFRNEIIVNP